MNQSTDQIIIDKILNGETNAFSEIVEMYKDLVYTLAIRLMKNPVIAEEMSQDAFIKVYKNLSKFKGESKLSSWIYRITYNTCLDELRRQKKNFNLVEINEFTENELKTIDNALTKMEDEELQSKLKNCIDELPEKMGFLLTLYYFEDHSIKDMADVVGEKQNTVKVNLHRARLKLASILKLKLEPEIIASYETKRG